MSTLEFGACSWKYPSWEHLVYSAAKDINYLAEYAQKYSTVEVDQWFWSLFAPDSIGRPQAPVVAEYAASVPESFHFTIKAPNAVTLTHFYRKGSQHGAGENPYFLSHELFAEFLEIIEPLKPHTTSVMLQFEYLNTEKMPSLGTFLDRFGTFLSDLQTDWPVSVEIRNPSFLKPAYFDLLREHGVPHVFCHGYYMPPVAAVYREHRERIIGPAVVRLIGPDRSGIEKITGKKWNTVVMSKDEELPAIADTLLEMLSAGLDVVVNVNNHYEGSAPLTIEKLERLVEERRARFSQMR